MDMLDLGCCIFLLLVGAGLFFRLFLSGMSIKIKKTDNKVDEEIDRRLRKAVHDMSEDDFKAFIKEFEDMRK